ncbi:MAG: ABC transporter ATP-binding protein [Kangiellaceae bacterium]|jgi:ABC-type multidrug transport system ATPase subunit|nr:ABC transporter ATP-binding protein [Kangiellaceae bacterium]
MLTIDSLSKTYANGVKALDNVSLTIEPGMFGLLGPNGAGKSSLMRTIATLQQPDSGSLTFDGVNILTEPDKLRSRLGYLPQDFDVYPRTSAYDLLDHMAILKGIENKNDRKESVEGLLAQTNLWEARSKAVSTFSGGMRQRFGIAQALLGDPSLIIVDEPTAGLDPEERNRFHNLLADIGESKIVLLSTHIVDDVEELCSNMAVLAQGSIQLKGKPQDVVETLKGTIWRKIINKDELEAHKSEFNIISTRLMAGRTVIHVMAENQPDASFESLTPDLEDVYFSTLFNLRNVA